MIVLVPAPAENLIVLDESLERLSGLDPAAGQLLKLRYFAGLSVEGSRRGSGHVTDQRLPVLDVHSGLGPVPDWRDPFDFRKTIGRNA